MWFLLVRGYGRLYGWMKERWGVQLRGYGWALRRLRKDRVLVVQGVRFYFSAAVASCYIRLVAGAWNEAETHLFLRQVLGAVGREVEFLDVGANVGEFAVAMGVSPKVRRVVAFEPIGACAAALRRSFVLNGLDTAVVVERVLSARVAEVGFASDGAAPNSSGVCGASAGAGVVWASTLDIECAGGDWACPILMMDVEGHELEVLRGAREFVGHHRPLIVFEYNAVSRQHFSVGQVRELLGPEYAVYRLNARGRLDAALEQAWNAVAFHRESVFACACQPLVEEA